MIIAQLLQKLKTRLAICPVLFCPLVLAMQSLSGPEEQFFLSETKKGGGILEIISGI